MTLIKCPHCGHTVLSVASHCPNCGGALGQSFLGLDHEGELAQCRACGHRVRTRTKTCPNCGLRDPARWPRSVRGWLAVAAALVVLLLALAVTHPEWPRRSASRALPSSAAVAVRRDTLRDAPAPPVVPAAPARADTLAPPPASVEKRWTKTWVNVRGGPSNEAPVVRVLRPGTAVFGHADKWGWWAVQLGGDSVGYIAGELLGTSDNPGDN